VETNTGALSKPFSYSIWKFLSSPGSLVNATSGTGTPGDANGVGGIGGIGRTGVNGEGQPTAAQLSIFRGGAVSARFIGKWKGKGRRGRMTFGFLRRSVDFGSGHGHGQAKIEKGEVVKGSDSDEKQEKSVLEEVKGIQQQSISKPVPAAKPETNSKSGNQESMIGKGMYIPLVFQTNAITNSHRPPQTQLQTPTTSNPTFHFSKSTITCQHGKLRFFL
jgi:hypothetical protein